MADINTIIDDDVIAELYIPMYRFAYNQLGDEQCARDVVQEALMNALKYADSFQGRSALKSWLFAILKNKISDHIRQTQKYIPLSDFSNDEQDDASFLEYLFDANGHWYADSQIQALSQTLENPADCVEQDDFWAVLELCLDNLPKEQARAFLMKEYIELDTEVICQELNISRQNYYVLMHRARLRLQTCLSIKWLDC
ncbi:sigma-70 family RNA polymerase sigma factor [Moraxella canis]|uniref:RNA polymerase subunit sigma n=1 Tax=Moraxella canis TaxID=90239 RepID=A0A1S9ZQ33_9GAMM|nr:sigma-70 family RNA polymerase sigma factor [Moraxella canis]OOR85566.1 RNA polymerase subunit sigma [Moraxella canis]